MKRTIDSVMTISPHTIGADQPLANVKRMMAAHGIRHLPVLQEGKCIGLVSDRDVKLAYAVDGSAATELTAAGVCSGDVYTVTPDEPFKDVAAHLARTGIGSVVVVAGAKVVGIFTTTDACRVLSETLE